MRAKANRVLLQRIADLTNANTRLREAYTASNTLANDTIRELLYRVQAADEEVARLRSCIVNANERLEAYLQDISQERRA